MKKLYEIRKKTLYFTVKTSDQSENFTLDKKYVPQTGNFFSELINGNITIPIVKEHRYYIFHWENLESYELYLNIKNFKHMINYLENGKVYNDIGFIYILQYFMLITNVDYTLDFLKVKLQEEFIRNHIKKVEKFPLQSKLRKTDTLFFFLLKYYFFNIEFTEDKDISLQNKVDAFKESTTFKESYNIIFQDIYIHLTFYSFLLQNIKSYNIDKKQLYTTIKMLKNIIDDEDLNAITKKDKLADYYKKFNITTEIDKFKLIIKYEYNELSIKYLQCIEIMHFLSKKLINYKEKYVANILPYFIKNRVTKQSFRNIHKILIFNNWNNILLAGESVLSFLMFNDVTNVNDFDLFIYGLKDEKQIYDRVLQILYLYENKPNCRFIKSEHAISILYDYKKKPLKYK